MKKNIAINGLGRIGRMVLRGALKSDDLNIVAETKNGKMLIFKNGEFNLWMNYQ